MTSSTSSSATRTTAPPRLDRRWYLAAGAPFFLIFVGSVVLTFADLEATRVATVGFGFPAWVVVPQGVAKVLGLVAILSRRSRLLTGLAFAGFLYDVLLALGAHLVQRGPAEHRPRHGRPAGDGGGVLGAPAPVPARTGTMTR